MPLPKPLSEVKKDLQGLLVDDMQATIKTLQGWLPDGDKKNQTILLEGRLNQATKDRVRNTASEETLQVANNQIRSNLLDLIDMLTEADFDPSARPPGMASPPPATVPKFVVIYDMADDAHCKLLNKHLNVLKIMKKIRVYNVNETLAEGLVARAQQEMADADYLLVLITVNLFNSPDWFEIVYNAMGEGRRIIPLRIEKADFDGTGLEKLRSLPTMNRAVSEFKSPDDAYVDIVSELKKLLPK
jgi:hypothetical protein